MAKACMRDAHSTVMRSKGSHAFRKLFSWYTFDAIVAEGQALKSGHMVQRPQAAPVADRIVIQYERLHIIHAVLLSQVCQYSAELNHTANDHAQTELWSQVVNDELHRLTARFALLCRLAPGVCQMPAMTPKSRQEWIYCCCTGGVPPRQAAKAEGHRPASMVKSPSAHLINATALQLVTSLDSVCLSHPHYDWLLHRQHHSRHILPSMHTS